MPAPIIRRIPLQEINVVKDFPFWGVSPNKLATTNRIISEQLIPTDMSALFDNSEDTFISFGVPVDMNTSIIEAYTWLTLDLGQPRNINRINLLAYKPSSGFSNAVFTNVFFSTNNPLTNDYDYWEEKLTSAAGTEGQWDSGRTLYKNPLSSTLPPEVPMNKNKYQYITFGIFDCEAWKAALNYLNIYEEFDTRNYDVEFDDALLGLEGWKNPRYYGSKLTGAKINTYTKGDTTYGLNPVIENKTTAIYIADTVIGGTEDPQFATIKGHSYVSINKILIINEEDDTVQILDKETEEFEAFQRFVTNDFPTGGKLNVKIIDPSIQNSLKSTYYCKMNKGWLLKSFSSGEYISGNLDQKDPFALFNIPGFSALLFNIMRNKSNAISNAIEKMGPPYLSASLYENKYTTQFYSGSFKLNSGLYNNDTTYELLSSSNFIIESLRYLSNNNSNTEVHLTLHDGTYDFAPEHNDERSISTFEVDSNQISWWTSGIEDKINNNCGHPWVPRRSYIRLKGSSGSKFWPTIPTTYTNPIYHLSYAKAWHSILNYCFYESSYTAWNNYTLGGDANVGGYSGSYTYELSFLDKAPTLIVDIDKDAELFDGIGNKPIALIPEFLEKGIKKNVEYYLEKAGLVDKTTNVKTQFKK